MFYKFELTEKGIEVRAYARQDINSSIEGKSFLPKAQLKAFIYAREDQTFTLITNIEQVEFKASQLLDSNIANLYYRFFEWYHQTA